MKMKKIMMSGSAEYLGNIMYEEGYVLTRIDVSADKEIQVWHFLLEQPHYDYEVKVEFQVNEYDEEKPVAINVIKVTCELI